MKSNVKISDDRYEISGGARSNSLVSIVSDAKAHFSSSGEITDNKLVTSDLNISYRAGKKSGHLKVGYDDGGVSRIEFKPKIKYKAGTIPVKKMHLQAVVDPVSSLLFPVKPADIGNGRKVCNRVLPVFDGRTRMNLVFFLQVQPYNQGQGLQGQDFKAPRL